MPIHKYKSIAGLIKRIEFSIFLLFILFFINACSNDIWDPNVVATVNGENIYKDELNSVLEWGFHPVVGAAADEKNEGMLHIKQILNKLIDERLILAEANNIGLTVSNNELELALKNISSAWFDENPPPGELAELKETLRRQILLKKVTEKIIEENTIFSASERDDFLAAWPMDKSIKYNVIILLAPPNDEVYKKLSTAGNKNLSKISKNLESLGIPIIVSEHLWLKSDKITSEAEKSLHTAWQANKKIAGPVRLEKSWAMYEILEVKEFNLQEEYLKATAAYETTAREKTFQIWLEKLRNQADIKLNPAFVSDNNQ